MLQACPNSNSVHAPRLQLTQISHKCTQNTHTHTHTLTHRNLLLTKKTKNTHTQIHLPTETHSYLLTQK